jgi:Na+/proline symporter
MSASTLGTIGLVGFLILAAASLTLALRLPRSRQVLSMAFFLGFAVFGVAALFSLIFFGKERAY